MDTGLLDELLAGQPVNAHASRQAHLQRMRAGLSSDGLERQQRMVTAFTSEPLLCNLERMGMGPLDEQLAGRPVSTHAWRQANLQRSADGSLTDGCKRQQRLATVFVTETPRAMYTRGGLKTPEPVM
jgi:hypothetical protein